MAFRFTKVGIAVLFALVIAPVVLVKPAAAQTKTAAAKQAPPKSDAASSGDAGLRQRVEQLEEQYVEMQVAIGTLESLAKGGASSSSGVYRGSDNNGGGGADAGRIAVLETQVRALANQVDQLSQALKQANGRAPAAAMPLAQAPPTAPFVDQSDPIGRLVNNGRSAPIGGDTGAAEPSMASAGASDASGKEAFENAYGYLLRQDYASAETAFSEFLQRYPNDQRAADAQYWLGDSFYARGQYKPAAAAFLKGYQTYPKSPKAPESVLKLGMALDKVGQKDAACAAYTELGSKFPNAPGHVKTRADAERRRLGCT